MGIHSTYACTPTSLRRDTFTPTPGERWLTRSGSHPSTSIEIETLSPIVAARAAVNHELYCDPPVMPKSLRAIRLSEAASRRRLFDSGPRCGLPAASWIGNETFFVTPCMVSRPSAIQPFDAGRSRSLWKMIFG